MKSYSLKIAKARTEGTIYGNLQQAGPRFRRSNESRYIAVMKCLLCETHLVMRVDHATDGKRKQCCTACAIQRCEVTTHGMSGTSEYRIWSRMIERCHNTNHVAFHRYGGRGIRVCREWMGDGGFERFLSEIGHRPSRRHQVDRIDNDKGYEPGNVRWVTATENGRNKSNNVLLTIGGVTKCVTEWSEVDGAAPKYRIYARKRYGWSDNEAVFGRGRS